MRTRPFVPELAGRALRIGRIDVDLRTLHPAGLRVVAAADLDATVAGHAALDLKPDSQHEVAVLLVGRQENVEMVPAADGVGQDRATVDRPIASGRLAIFGQAIDMPAVERLSIEERREPLVGRSRAHRRREQHPDPDDRAFGHFHEITSSRWRPAGRRMPPSSPECMPASINGIGDEFVQRNDRIATEEEKAMREVDAKKGEGASEGRQPRRHPLSASRFQLSRK